MSDPAYTLSANGQLNLMDYWKAAHDTKSEALHCANPRCPHLDHVPHDDAARAACGIVKKTVDGATKDFYRFPKGEEIYLASFGARGHVVCAECHKAGGEAGRAEWWRACVREMYGDDSDVTCVDLSFKRLQVLEKLNDNLHDDGTKLAEFGNGHLHAPDGEGTDDAQRKEEIKRRHAEVQVARKTAASKAIDKTNAETLLARYQSGCTIDPKGKEEDDTVDVGDEDGEKALELYNESDGDALTVRARFPKHANRWWGRAPTEEETAAQTRLVEKLASEADAAKAEFDVVQEQLNELEKQLVEDLEEEAFGEEASKGRGSRKQKDVANMTFEEAVAHEEKRRRNAETRAKSNARKREMLEEHPKLLARADKCEAVEAKLEETTRKLETLKGNAASWKDAVGANEAQSKEMEHQMAAMEAQLATAKKKLEKVENRYARLKDTTVAWLVDEPKGKPTGWSANDMVLDFQAFVKRRKPSD